MPSRRSFLKGALLGSLTLATGASVWQLSLSEAQPLVEQEDYPYQFLSLDHRLLLFVLVPAYLTPALSPDAPPKERFKILHNIDTAIGFLSQSSQAELKDLLNTLSHQLGRAYLAGVWSSWNKADLSRVQEFLKSWQNSYFLLLRSGYVGLHQIIFGAFYGLPESWSAIGYTGPPQLNLPDSFYESDDQL